MPIAPNALSQPLISAMTRFETWSLPPRGLFANSAKRAVMSWPSSGLASGFLRNLFASETKPRRSIASWSWLRAAG